MKIRIGVSLLFLSQRSFKRAARERVARMCQVRVN